MPRAGVCSRTRARISPGSPPAAGRASRLAALLLCLAAAGCGKEPAAPAPSPAASAAPASVAAPAPPVLAIAGDGLQLTGPRGATRPLAFGMEWRDALAALAFRGQPRTGRMDECGAGPLTYAKWDDGFTLYGQNGAFMGWFVDSQAAGKLAAAGGIGPGSTRAQLDRAYAAEVFESTLGTEFLAGDLGGLLDGTGRQARVTALWAGVSCNFR